MTSIADAVDQLTARLRTDLTGVADRIQAEQDALIQRWPSLAAAARRRALAAALVRVLALAGTAQDIARAQVHGVLDSVYRLGAGHVAASIGAAPVLTGADLDAISVLAGDTYRDVLAATRHVQETSKTLVRTLARERIADKLVIGQTPAEASRRLAADLQGRGISAITYKDGAQHGLRDYADMLVRTKSAEAQQLGGFAQARAIGIEYMEILDGPGCGWSSHRDLRKANGLILTVDEAAQYPTSHPRCRRVSSPRPDLSTPAEAATATPLGPQFSAEDIARGHADSSVSSAAVARSQARVAARAGDRTLVTERAASRAERSNAARVRKRTVPAGRTA